MFGRLGIRGKIFAVVAVPILVLIIVAGSVTAATFRTYDSAKNSSQLLEVSQATHNLTVALQDERDAGVNFIHFLPFAIGVRDAAEAKTDAQYQAVLAAAASAPPASRAAAADAIASIDSIVSTDGLAGARAVNVVINPIMGPQVDANGDPVYPPLLDEAGNPVVDEAGDPVFDETNGPVMVIQGDEWPVWPDAATLGGLVSAYNRLQTDLTTLTGQVPAETGMVDELTYYAELMGVEETAATNLLTTPETYVPPVIQPGGVLPPVPVYVATYQEIFATQSAAVDGLLATLTESTSRISHRDVNADTRAHLSTAIDALGGLADERDVVRNRSDTPAVVSNFYSDAINSLLGSLAATSANLPNRSIAGALTAYTDIDVLAETLRQEEMVGQRAIREGSFADQAALYGFVGLKAKTDAAFDAAAASVATIPDVPPLVFGTSFDPRDQTSFGGIRSDIVRTLVAPGEQQRSNWALQADEELAAFSVVQTAVWDHVQSVSKSATRGALVQTLATALGAAVIVFASLFVALLIARRIVGPLRRLTTTATAVRQELPRLVERVALPGQTVDVSEVQIPVESADEIGRLAEAFNAVNAATLAIAGEQAALRGSISEMFVNVARRDQVLLNRQLASIDEMERAQDDPDTLTRLFALDHLATRMRRNSESLLVLAGIDTGRRMRRAMPLSDVIRTASSEIELYERVQLELDADPAMVGHSALTAGHLFAELLENATVFSDPGTPVVVRTSRKDDNIVVEIIDQGIGMTPDELHEANSRVMSTAASEILGAQRLGLFVVGRIARRLGARVEILSQEGKGATAIVSMPLSLFDMSAEPEVDHTTGSAADPRLHVPAALIGHDASEEEMDVYSADVMTPAIAGVGYHAAPVGDEVIDIEALIKEDAASAPESAPVDLDELTAGKTAKGLPARRRRSPSTAEAKPETGSVLGLPERPTSGQLEQLSAAHGGAFIPEGTEVEEPPKSAEQRSAMFRGFRARRGEEGPRLDPDAESLGQAARRGAVAPDAEPLLAEEGTGEASEPSSAAIEPAAALDVPFSLEPVPGADLGAESGPGNEATAEGTVSEEPPVEVPAMEVPATEETTVEGSEVGEAEEGQAIGDDGPAWSAAPAQGWGISAGFDHGAGDYAGATPSPDASGSLVPDLEPVASAEVGAEWADVPEPTDSAEATGTPEWVATDVPAVAIPDEGAPESEPEAIPVVPSSFSWDAIPTGDAAFGGAETPREADEAIPVPFDELAAGRAEPNAVKEKGKKQQKERRPLFGKKKGKDEEKTLEAAPFAPPVTEALPAEAPATDEVPAPVSEAVTTDAFAPAIQEPSPATDEFDVGVVTPMPQYDEWGLPVGAGPVTPEMPEETPVSAALYDEWGLPIVAAPHEAIDLDLPAEAFAPTVPTDFGLPAFDATPDLNVPPLTDEFTVPSMGELLGSDAFPASPEGGAAFAIDYSALAEEGSPEMGTPPLPVPDLGLYGSDFVEVPAQPSSGEIPDLTVQPISGEFALPPEVGAPSPGSLPEPYPTLNEPTGGVPSLDAILGGATDAPWAVEAPLGAASDIPYAAETPYGFDPGTPQWAAEVPSGSAPEIPWAVETPSGVIPDVPYAAESAYESLAIPYSGEVPLVLEPEPLYQAEEVGLPDLPPPSFPVADFPSPSVVGYEGEGYGASAFGTEAYGAAAQAYTLDEFAQPYGWEAAGASALAATVDIGYGGYSPEAFAPTAPPPPDGLEAEMASAVFSELSSLTTERPKVQRTHAGLQKRTRAPGAPTEPTPIADIEPKPVLRDAEAVRASFSDFHSATTRGRSDVGDLPHIHGTPPDEVTP